MSLVVDCGDLEFNTSLKSPRQANGKSLWKKKAKMFHNEVQRELTKTTLAKNVFKVFFFIFSGLLMIKYVTLE